MRVKSNQLCNIAFFLILLDVISASLDTFIIRYAFLPVYLGVAILLFLNLRKKKAKALKLSTYSVFLVIIALILLGAVRGGGLTEKSQLYIIILLSFILARHEKSVDEFVVKLFLYSSLIFAVATIWLSQDRNAYIQHIVPLYPHMTNRLVNWYNEGLNAGLTGHYSTNGMILANGMLIAGTAVLTFDDKKTKLKWYILSAIFVIALFLTGKRAHLLFCFVAIFMAYIVWKGKSSFSNHIVQALGFVLLAGIIIYIAYLVNPVVAQVLNRFQNMGEDQNITSRYMFWELAWSNFIQHPFWGIGWGNFYNLSGSYFNYFAQVHNVYLQILCENGILVFVLLIGWFARNIYNAIRKSRKFSLVNMENTNCSWLSLFAVAYQVYFLLYCITGNPLYDTYTYVLYFTTVIIASRPFAKDMMF